jgi:hypothetical protein
MCEHEFEYIHSIWRIYLWGLIKREQVYSCCKKCGIYRHDNDGELFWGDGIPIKKEKAGK